MTDLEANHPDPSKVEASQVTAVSCNRCGGTLDDGERTIYTTCGFWFKQE